MTKIYIDLETFSSVNIMLSGAYKYTESIDFEILILCYKINDREIITVDLAQGEQMSPNFISMLLDEEVELHAHNANFERLCFKAYGWDIPIWRWHCTAVKAAYCGLPLSLANVSEAMKLEEKGKLATGKALIKFFSVPIKATKANGMRVRNLPHHDLEKWEEYKRYCHNDVEAEYEIDTQLIDYEIPPAERQLYILDQEINDRGILIDLVMAKNATIINSIAVAKMGNTLKELTRLDNPNSPAQLKQWLSEAMQKDITTLAKANIIELLAEADTGEVRDTYVYTEDDLPGLGYSEAQHGGWLHKSSQSEAFYGSGMTTNEVLNWVNRTKAIATKETVNEVLTLRQQSSKTSVKKYTAMLNCACDDNRAHGLFQFYGANRTGRWAGRLIQMQNLPQNHLDFLEQAREAVYIGDYEYLEMICDNIPDVLSQLIRTTFIAKTNYTFAVADFSAIEARVLAWLANEQWKIDVFNTHGKIYEAAAALMFNIPIESVTKGSDYRTKGKTAELALGYGGAVGAFKNMSGKAAIDLSDPEVQDIVDRWRDVNPETVGMWKHINNAAIRAIKTRKPVVLSQYKNLIFDFDGKVMTIQLPSGRKLFYQEACLFVNKWGKAEVKYKGLDQKTKKWWWVDTYGGKLTENIIQAIARDCLAHAMLKLKAYGFEICLHVHDEAAAEVLLANAKESLKQMCEIMGQPIEWAPGLSVPAEGYITKFYKKD